MSSGEKRSIAFRELACSLGGLRPVEDVCRARHTAASRVPKDVGVDHGGLDIFVTEQLLDRPDVVAVLQEVGRKGMPERVAGGLLRNTCPQLREPHRPLQDRLVEVMPAPLAVSRSV